MTVVTIRPNAPITRKEKIVRYPFAIVAGLEDSRGSRGVIMLASDVCIIELADVEAMEIAGVRTTREIGTRTS